MGAAPRAFGSSERVFEIDTATRAVTRTFDTESSWSKMVEMHDGSRIVPGIREVLQFPPHGSQSALHRVHVTPYPSGIRPGLPGMLGRRACVLPRQRLISRQDVDGDEQAGHSGASDRGTV